MKKYEIGNIIKTKEGDTCVIVDNMKKEAMVFNIIKLKEETKKIRKIKEKTGEADCTTMIINGKKVSKVEGKIEKEKETEEEYEDATKKFAELLKTFGQAAIELGNIFDKIAEEEPDEE